MAKKPKKQAATPEEVELQRVSSSSWNDYVARFRPAEAALAKQAKLTAGERAQVKGEVSADVAEAFKGLTRDTIASGGRAGADVSSGKTKLGLAADARAAGTARGVGASIAETGAEIDESEQLLGIAATGRGLANTATANLSRGAHRATNLALAASNAKFERNRALVQGISAIAGAGAAKYLEVRGKKTDFGSDLVKIEPFSSGSSKEIGVDTFNRLSKNSFPTPFGGV